MIFGSYIDTDDIESSVYPNWAIATKTIKKIRKILLVNRKVKLRVIVDTLNVSKDSSFTILHNYLSRTQVCSKWVPRFLTFDQKQRFGWNERGFFHTLYDTMDNTWIDDYTLEANRRRWTWKEGHRVRKGMENHNWILFAVISVTMKLRSRR